MKIEEIKAITSNPKIKLLGVSGVYKSGPNIGKHKIIFGEFVENNEKRIWDNHQAFYVDEETMKGFKRMYWHC